MTYIDELERVVPKQLMATKIDLSPVGVKDMAWRYQDVMKVFKIVRQNGLVNLGGDVFKVSNSEVDATWDAWDYTLDRTLPWETNVKRSYQKATKFVKSYKNDNGEGFCYGVVVIAGEARQSG